MKPLLSAAQMREADRYTIETLGLPELVLMEHAALALVESLEARFGKGLPDTRGVVIAGPGNNGGDVLAAVRLLDERGCGRIILCLEGDENRLSPACALQLKVLSRLGYAWVPGPTDEVLAASDWVLDGLFGTGLSRSVEGAAAACIERVNRFHGKKWIVSADIPSGLSADTGNPLGVAVQASETVSLGFFKRGLVTGRAAEFVGRLRLAPIQIPRTVPIQASAFLYDREDAARLPARSPAGHKGLYGHVFVWAGEPSREGAAILSSLAALRAGAGLVSLVGIPAALAGARARAPAEIMTETWEDPTRLREPKTGEVLALGPGMGTLEESWHWLESALRSEWDLVLDADALNLMAKHAAEARQLVRRRSDRLTVMTPHPKEAARLLEIERIPDDRYEALDQLLEAWPVTVLLKGKGTLVGAPGRPPIVVTTGSPVLSKGGSGDVLTGIIASLLAQRVKVEQAVPLGAWLHGRASEWVAQKDGEARSAMASEIAAALARVFCEIESWKDV